MAKRKTKKPASKEASRPPYTRGNHLEWLKNRGQLSDAQYRAGCQIRALFAEKEGRAKSLDLLNDRVDGGGGSRDFLFVATVDADRKLKALARFLGVDQACAVFLVVGLGLSVAAVVDQFEDGKQEKDAKASRATSDYVGRLVRSGLSHAAFHFGYAVRGPDRTTHRVHFWEKLAG